MGHIRIDSLTKRFDDVLAVDDVTLEITDGEFLVLVGPSGCGKSTTLRCLAGLETPSSGDIHFDGDLVNYRVPQERDVAMVFQDYALYPHMTVRGNIRFGLEQESGYTDAERATIVEDVAEMLGIEDLLDRKPDELSGGQQQRVALGRSIVRDPTVFLMDEPLSNLDAKLRAEMRTELQQLQADLGVTTIYVTHDQTEAMTMSDRMAVMDQGRLQQVGDPLTLYHAPANRFVAEFLGEPSMNFLEGTRRDDRFIHDQLEYRLDSEMRTAVGDAEALTLGIRPEDVQLDTDPEQTTATHGYRMDVSVVEPMGNENVVHLGFPDDPEEPDAITAITSGMRRIEEGRRVEAVLPSEAIHIFDAATGEALHNRRHPEQDTVIETAP